MLEVTANGHTYFPPYPIRYSTLLTTSINCIDPTRRLNKIVRPPYVSKNFRIIGVHS